ncbi:GNAT family N-acetyltransferase [Streptomyces sp. NBC_00237]|uniref:GNAT family N-acetyltransferase n=1 Tax=Streptomyces sp. NBC_00237 TaxID=2975687 RepID=UPI002259CA87|nr:GNAT family N-acetyltransferase [Streptomyces sp. NBC_00237]MCX5200400.1 GNAT family N-acetyltransferase [Streptomyces sp. NBC_00237]
MIRRAVVEDVPEIHAMVRELAEYEKALDEVRASEEQLREALFGESPAAFAHVAEGEGGEAVGFALWFLSFSTWRGVHGIYLEDLIRAADGAGRRARKALLAELARTCVERGYERLEWSVVNYSAVNDRAWRLSPNGFVYAPDCPLRQGGHGAHFSCPG